MSKPNAVSRCFCKRPQSQKVDSDLLPTIVSRPFRSESPHIGVMTVNYSSGVESTPKEKKPKDKLSKREKKEASDLGGVYVQSADSVYLAAKSATQTKASKRRRKRRNIRNMRKGLLELSMQRMRW